MRRRKNLEGLGGKRVVRFAVDRFFYIKLLSAEIDHVFCLKDRRHFRFHFYGVVASDAENNNRRNIPKNRVEHRRKNLADVLVRDRKIEAVLSRLGKKIQKRRGDNIMKLINVKIKIRALILRYLGSPHPGLLHFCNKHRTEETRILLADFPLCEIDQKDFF